MSPSASVARRCLSREPLNSRHVQRRAFWNLPETPKDAANELAGRLLSNEYYERRYSYKQPPGKKSIAQILNYLGQGADPLTSQQRFAMFRDLISRCEPKDYKSISRTGIRHTLRGSRMPIRPSELLREGESILRSHPVSLGRAAQARSDTIGLEDANSTILRLLSAREQTDLEEKRRLLRIFNAFVSRMESNGHSIGAILAGEGQCLAANARSTGALVQYAQRSVLESSSYVTRARDLGATISSIRLWLIDELEDKREKTALSSLFAKGGLDMVNASNTAFRSQFVALNPEWRWDYLDVLRRLYGAKEVLVAWNEFQTSLRWNELMKENSDESLTELASSLHDVVEQLLMAKEPQMAWVIVHSLGWEPKAVLPKTWALLLEYPEFLTQMNEGMQEVLLQVYEEQIEAIEGTLGVRWTGGEDGAHVLLDDGRDPQALVEDVNMSEDAQRD